MKKWQGLHVDTSPRGELQHRCALPGCTIRATPKLELPGCTGCHVVRYCGKKHQMKHWKVHKTICNKIKKAQAFLAAHDTMTRETRTRLVLDLAKVNTLDSCQAVVAQLEKEKSVLLRSFGSGSWALLRLNEDQKCYDFIKGFKGMLESPGETEESVEAYTREFIDTSTTDPFTDDASFLFIQSEDMDPRKPFLRRIKLSHMVAILILKLKLLVDIRNIKITRKALATSPLPPELHAENEAVVVRSPLSARLVNKDRMELLRVEDTLASHVCRIGLEIHKQNQHFLKVLMVGDGETQGNGREEAGQLTEAEGLLNDSRSAWWEMEGVLEMMDAMAAACYAENIDKLNDAIRKERLSPTDGQGLARYNDLTKEITFGEGRLWRSIRLGLQAASFLGPAEDNPVEVVASAQRKKHGDDERAFGALNNLRASLLRQAMNL